MISNYLTDLIDIIQITYDKYGVSTETPILNINARVEDTNVMVSDSEGKEVNARMLIMIEPREIQPQWKVKIKKKNGRTYYQPDKKWEILSFEQSNMMGLESHIEIRL
jgi:phage pi2 protein 07